MRIFSGSGRQLEAVFVFPSGVVPNSTNDRYLIVEINPDGYELPEIDAVLYVCASSDNIVECWYVLKEIAESEGNGNRLQIIDRSAKEINLYNIP